jgi:hypothetical protein
MAVTIDSTADLDQYGPAELTFIFSDTDPPRLARALVGAGDRLEDQAVLVTPASGRRLIVTVPDKAKVLELIY